jgi:YggT family protein
VLGPLRRAIPPLGIGGMALDLSPLILIIGVNILLGVLGCGGGLL